MNEYVIHGLRISKKVALLTALFSILAVGLFLRTYHFHDWLEFKGDQSRDASLVQGVVENGAVWPLLGPAMGNYSTDNGTHFKVGPIYYYFQILSAKIFGMKAEAMAYPDVFFGILSIPLLFFFFKKLFDDSVSLALTGLYAVSFFAVRFSRFAWNSNLIPFFVLLFLLSLYEFKIKGEQARWRWVVLLGTALGVGIQLHVILLILFSSFFLLVSVHMLVRQRGVWKRLLVVCVIAAALNIGQIRSEAETGFANMGIFLNYFAQSEAVDGQASVNRGYGPINDIGCHIEANSYMISSFGQDSCAYYYDSLLFGRTLKDFKSRIFMPSLFAGLAFSIFGYVMLAYRFLREKDRDKRMWIRFVVSYLGLSLLIMLPIVGEKLELRYFSFAFFVPFMFLGFLTEYAIGLHKKWGWAIVSLVFLILLASNAKAYSSIIEELQAQKRIYSHSVVLGEIEPIVKYLIDHSGGQTDIYLGGDYKIMDYSFQPLSYLIAEQGKNLIWVDDTDIGTFSRSGAPVFYVNNELDSDNNTEYEKIGQKTYVYTVMANSAR